MNEKMRTISWTHQPLIVLFAAAIAAGCGSDSKPAASTDAGLSAKCGNGKLDTGEACDGTLLGGKTCSTATSGAKTGGTPSCDSTCKLVVTGCTSAAGTGGGGGVGTGGAAAGGAPSGGSGGKGSGGKGGTGNVDGGTASGGTGGTGGGNPVDAGKG
jgi:hypothetical protein